MPRSTLQEPFVQEVADTFQATRARIARRMADASESVDAILDDEMRGLYHGLFVILDGGTVLAEEGSVRVTDEDGVPFDRFLHELCFRYWPSDQT